MQPEIAKSGFLSGIIPSEFVSLNCPYEEQDAFHQQPMC